MGAEEGGGPGTVGIGADRPRIDAAAKVRGQFGFAPDEARDGMLWGATLRSPHALARLRKVDLWPAKNMPGVEAVLGAWDVPDNFYGVIDRDTPVLADDYVRYEGEPIAIVAAVDRETARRAAEAIVVEYDVLEPEVDPEIAKRNGAVYRHVDFTHGDPSVVGEVQVEGEYSTPRQDHSFLAPDGGVAEPDGRGGVIVTGATQWVHNDRAQIAAALALPDEMVLVRNSGVGGSFGGRFVISWQIHGALLALHTGRPVKFLYTRRETFLARYHRNPSRIWMRRHATTSGEIVKLEARLLYECGPYSNTAGAAIGNGSSLIQGPYRVRNAHVKGWSVATNNGMTGSLRGFGAVEPGFASESNMDALAAAVGLDGAELRRRNAMREGDAWIFDQRQDRPTPVADLIEAVQGHPLPDALGADPHPVDVPGGRCSPTRPQDVVRAVGVSSTAKNVCLSEGAPVDSTALVTLRDGAAVIDCAAAEVGQGFITVAVQVAQTALGVSDVTITGVDSSMAPAATTDGQQQTMTSGAAVAIAAARVKQRFLRFYAREYGGDASKLDIADDWVVDEDGNRLATVADAGMGLAFRATETFAQRRTRPLDDHDSPDPMHVAVNFSASRCVVDVDVELGLVKVVQIDVVQDAGRVVNPAQAAGQIEGGVLMGVGLALMESMEADRGHMLNTDWSTYIVPTAVDAPPVVTEFVEHPEPGIPYGMRGIAELPHVQSPPAVAAALRQATGLELPALPATPQRVCGLDSSNPAVALGRGRVKTMGPWKIPEVRTGVGPWRAVLPDRE